MTATPLTREYLDNARAGNENEPNPQVSWADVYATIAALDEARAENEELLATLHAKSGEHFMALTERDEARADAQRARAERDEARRDLAQLRNDMQAVSYEDERGHALIDAANGEDPDTSSADTLADRVEQLLAERDALKAEVAALRRELGAPGPDNHDETPLRAKLAAAESRIRDLEAEVARLTAERDSALLEAEKAWASSDAEHAEAEALGVELRAARRRLPDSGHDESCSLGLSGAERDECDCSLDVLLERIDFLLRSRQ